MNPDDLDDLRKRLHLLQWQNHDLQNQNAMLEEAIDMICAAFLNNGAGLETAIQAALSLQHRVSRSSDKIQSMRPAHQSDLEID